MAVFLCMTLCKGSGHYTNLGTLRVILKAFPGTPKVESGSGDLPIHYRAKSGEVRRKLDAANAKVKDL